MGQKLTASSGGIENYFGDIDQIAMDNNNRIIVGAFKFENGRGVAYVYGKKDESSNKSSDYTEMVIL
jgi:hypothetical protein